MERKGQRMQDISREYIILFNAITQAEKDLQRLRESLILTQQLAEEAYISHSPAES